MYNYSTQFLRPHALYLPMQIKYIPDYINEMKHLYLNRASLHLLHRHAKNTNYLQ